MAGREVARWAGEAEGSCFQKDRRMRTREAAATHWGPGCGQHALGGGRTVRGGLEEWPRLHGQGRSPGLEDRAPVQEDALVSSASL